MGQKYSIGTANWTIDDWAFGTGENAVQIEDIIDVVKQTPVKYFGGGAIANDTSIQHVQRDLPSFDDTLKRIFFRRKNNKQSKEQYYVDNQLHYDQNRYSIPEEDENELMPMINNE